MRFQLFHRCVFLEILFSLLWTTTRRKNFTAVANDQFVRRLHCVSNYVASVKTNAIGVAPSQRMFVRRAQRHKHLLGIEQCQTASTHFLSSTKNSSHPIAPHTVRLQRADGGGYRNECTFEIGTLWQVSGNRTAEVLQTCYQTRASGKCESHTRCDIRMFCKRSA